MTWNWTKILRFVFGWANVQQLSSIPDQPQLICFGSSWVEALSIYSLPADHAVYWKKRNWSCNLAEASWLLSYWNKQIRNDCCQMFTLLQKKAAFFSFPLSGWGFDVRRYKTDSIIHIAPILASNHYLRKKHFTAITCKPFGLHYPSLAWSKCSVIFFLMNQCPNFNYQSFCFSVQGDLLSSSQSPGIRKWLCLVFDIDRKKQFSFRVM